MFFWLQSIYRLSSFRFETIPGGNVFVDPDCPDPRRHSPPPHTRTHKHTHAHDTYIFTGCVISFWGGISKNSTIQMEVKKAKECPQGSAIQRGSLPLISAPWVRKRAPPGPDLDVVPEIQFQNQAQI